MSDARIGCCRRPLDPATRLGLVLLLWNLTWAAVCAASDPVSAARLSERQTLENEAVQLATAQRYGDAIRTAEQLLGIERAVYGPLHEQVQGTLVALRALALEVFDFPAARSYTMQRLVACQERYGPMDWRVADVQRDLEDVELIANLSNAQRERLKTASAQWTAADAQTEKGAEAEALLGYQAVLPQFRALFGEQHHLTTRLLKSQAAAELRTGAIEASVRHLRTAVEIERLQLGPRHPVLAEALSQLGAALIAQEQPEDALRLLQEAERMADQTADADDPLFASLYENLLRTADMLGDGDECERVHQLQCDWTRRTAGPHSLQSAARLSEFALALEARGGLARAEPLLRAALAISRNSVEPAAAAATAIYLNNLGRFSRLQGDLEQAGELYDEALQLIARSQGTESVDYAQCLHNRAVLALYQEDSAAAERDCRAALAIQQRLIGEESVEAAASSEILAVIFEAADRPEDAGEIYQELIRILRRPPIRDIPALAATLHNYALMSQAFGAHEEALPLFDESLKLWEQRLGARHPNVAIGLANQARSLWAVGRHDDAWGAARLAARLQREHVTSLVAIQSDRQQILSSAVYRDGIDTLVRLTAESGPVNEADYEEILQVKGRVLRRQIEVRALARAMQESPEVAGIVRELQTLSGRLASAALAAPQAVTKDGERSSFVELSDRLERLQRELARRTELLRAPQAPITTAAVRKALPERSVLIDFLLYSGASDAEPTERDRPTLRLAAFVVRPDDRQVRFVELGPVAPLAEAIDAWRDSYGEAPPAKQAGALLRQRLWEPFADYVTGRTLVLLSPDGLLGRLPFSALPGRQPGTYLLEEAALATIPCAWALPGMFDKSAQSKRPVVDGNLLIVANVDYDAQVATPPEAAIPSSFGRYATEVRGLSDFKFTPLWATRGESAVIEKLYRSKYATGITVLEQTDASKDRFCVEAPRHKFLHIATHGFFAPAPLTSRIDSQLRRSKQAAASDLSPRRQLPAGVLSGLAFAGANAEGRGNDASGLLLAAEVETLDLRGVELAVLSACETGLGELAGTEGLLGLQRSFQVAGAETVIASLWEIPDDATRSLMEHFYDFRLKKRLGTLAALREAQLTLLREGRRRGLVRVDRPTTDPAETRVPPFYWGAFVLSGDWR